MASVTLLGGGRPPRIPDFSQPTNPLLPTQPTQPRQAPTPPPTWDNASRYSQPTQQRPSLWGPSSQPSGSNWSSPDIKWNAGPENGDYRSWFFNLVKSVTPENGSINARLEPILTQYGFQITPPNAEGKKTKIRLPDGTWVRVVEGNNQWTWVPQGAESSGGGGGLPTTPPIGDQGVPQLLSSYAPQFDDAPTRQLEQYLQAQLNALEEQRHRQALVDPYFRTTIQNAEKATGTLVDYLRQRAGRLQEAPYTGAEREVLRTEALDPIEADRQAARQRALQRIGNQGFDQTSGIAQSLLNSIDQAYDIARARSQHDIALRTIDEQQNRQREAQTLLAMVPDVLRGGAGASLGLIQALDAALNLPRQQGIPLAAMIQDLPNRAMQQALAAMGTAQSPQDLFQSALQLYQIGQQNQIPWWQLFGSSLSNLFNNWNQQHAKPK